MRQAPGDGSPRHGSFTWNALSPLRRIDGWAALQDADPKAPVRQLIRRRCQFDSDLTQGTLPAVAFVDSIDDEHPPSNVQKGQTWVEARVRGLLASPEWDTSALLFTYDEAGGFFDHVPPPAACAPATQAEGGKPGFDRFGFRLPFVAMSPYVKHHYVSHERYDQTSILKFIENKFNLPSLTRRDANATDLADLFDYAHPYFTVPQLPAASTQAQFSCDTLL